MSQNILPPPDLNDLIPLRPVSCETLTAVSKKKVKMGFIFCSERAVIFHDNSRLAVMELHVKWGQGSGQCSHLGKNFIWGSIELLSVMEVPGVREHHVSLGPKLAPRKQEEAGTQAQNTERAGLTLWGGVYNILSPASYLVLSGSSFT